jgi:hypothetical protein
MREKKSAFFMMKNLAANAQYSGNNPLESA